MPKYVALINFTDKGAASAKDTVRRAAESGALIESMGGKLELSLWTLGQYDVVAVIDAPDDETITAVQLALASGGNVRTQTLRAFDKSEIQEVLDKIQ